MSSSNSGETRLLIATRNSGKMAEYAGLLRDAPFELVSLADLGITHDVDETGATFHENAWLKASQYAGLAGILTLADDSGLEVDALGGEPGVLSARYGGDACGSDAERVDLLLENLKDVPWERRTARFYCVINIIVPETGKVPSTPPSERGKIGTAPGDSQAQTTLLASVVGSVAGMIQYSPVGDDGFGYDPVFYLPSYDKTIAQLSLDEKNLISHRANAAAKARRKLSAISGQPGPKS